MCIISHSHHFVFVHVPKNAGTSVAAFLSPLTTYRDQEIGATELGEAAAMYYRNRFGLSKHSTIGEIRAVVGAQELSSYTTFGVVRDPLERVRSLFRFLHRWRAWAQLPQYAEPAAEFFGHRDINLFLRSPFFRSPGPDRLFEPQAHWLTLDTPEIGVDRILRVETLAQDLAGLSRVFDLFPAASPAMLRQLNATPDPAGDPVVELQLEGSSLEVIHSRYAADFHLFGYPAERL